MPRKKTNTKATETGYGTGRTRNFATVVYPESAPVNWLNLIDELHIPVLVSPLHDKDINNDGTLKKPHYHVVFMYDSVKDFEKQVKPIFDLIGGVGREYINSLRGYARYLCHLDNPEKHQYNPDDILSFGGADYSALVHLPTDDVKMLKEIFAYIRSNQVYSLAEFLDICAEKNEDWFSAVALSKAYIVDKYIKSLAWEEDVQYIRKSTKLLQEQKEQEELVIDAETGEVVG